MEKERNVKYPEGYCIKPDDMLSSAQRRRGAARQMKIGGFLFMELLAVFDENGVPTGGSVDREQAHREGVLHGASHTFLYRRAQGRVFVLLQRRSPEKDSFPGRLDISSAGHVEAGMDFEETARKELMEELGLDVSSGELYEAFSQRFSAIDEFHGKRFHNEEIDRVYLLERAPEPASLKLQPEEVSEVLWMDAEELAERSARGDSEICIDPQELQRALDAIGKRLREG